MEKQQRLPEDLLFEADGHVTEVVLACLADGELALVPATAAEHVDACDACTARLGAAALRSLDAGEALRSMGSAAALEPEPAALAPSVAVSFPAVATPGPERRARRPIPYVAISAALLVAAVASVPGLFDAAAEVPRLLGLIPVLARVVVALLRGSAEGLFPAALALKWAASLVLILAGLALSRAMSRPRSLQGGME